MTLDGVNDMPETICGDCGHVWKRYPPRICSYCGHNVSSDIEGGLHKDCLAHEADLYRAAEVAEAHHQEHHDIDLERADAAERADASAC